MREQIFHISNDEEFKKLALEIFKFQHQTISVYRSFCDHLGIDPEKVSELEQIPFLPISLFKNHQVLDGANFQMEFRSSGTTGQSKSKHYVKDLNLYDESFSLTFKNYIGDPSNFVILSLLPSYRNNEHSSLIYMINALQKIGLPGSEEVPLDQMPQHLKQVQNSNEIILFGVTYALLDLIEQVDFPLENVNIIETGGMKGNRQEITRQELYARIHDGLKPKAIYSEYGMTELLSQAYSKNGSGFQCPPWMKIMIRDLHDPLSYIQRGNGGINVIDLANIHSCAFISTSDLGRQNNEGFEVLGRFDYSDIRGCNLLYQS